MDYIPAIKLHKDTELRWSNKHSISTLQDLISPYIDQLDSREVSPGVQIAAAESDLIYVSSENSVTVLLGALGCKTEIKGEVDHIKTESEEDMIHNKTELAKDVVLIPAVSDIQVFQTQLSVMGVSVGSDNTVILHTMYHVILLRKTDDKYEEEILYTSEEHILSAMEGESGDIYIVTVSTLLQRRGEEIAPLLDLSDLWRVQPIDRITFTQYKEWFVIAEPSAVHFLNETERHTACTVPDEHLEYTERFFSVAVSGDDLVIVSSSYVLVYNICIPICLEVSLPNLLNLEMKLKLSHNVEDAHSAQFYPSQTNCIKFSVFSDLKCSFFNLEDKPRDCSLVTFLLPYNHVKMKSLCMSVLEKPSYLDLAVDKRNFVTKRMNSGICGAYFSDLGGQHFILNKHKDLFYSAPEIIDSSEREKLWSAWFGSVTPEDQFWIENHSADTAYSNLLNEGQIVSRTRTLGARTNLCNASRSDQIKSAVEESVESGVQLSTLVSSRDPVLEGADDKYVNFLLDNWDWS